MITDDQAEKAVDYLRDKSGEYAQAKAERAYLEQFRKSKKAILMNQVEGPEHVKAAYAYAHHEYLEVLEGYRAAVEQEESLKWMLTAAQTKFECWRTQQANNRRGP